MRPLFEEVESEKQEWEIRFAWDNHATFMNAKSRAISDLRNFINKICKMVRDDEERLLKLELVQANITKAKAETDKLTKDNKQVALPTILQSLIHRMMTMSKVTINIQENVSPHFKTVWKTKKPYNNCAAVVTRSNRLSSLLNSFI